MQPIADEKLTRNRHSRVRLRTLDSLDRRTVAAKRALELETNLTAEVGMGLPIPEQDRQFIRRAAMLGALAEDAEARILAGENINRAEYLSMVRAQHKALEALGLAASED